MFSPEYRRVLKLSCVPSFKLLVAFFLLALPVNAQTAKDIAQRSFPSVLLLVMEDANGQAVSLGSGFFVRPGIIATNKHVIEGASRGYAKLVGKKEKHDILGFTAIDEKHDLVLLSIQHTKPPSLRVANATQPEIGEPVFVIGNPMGLEGTLSEGIVSGIRSFEEDTILQITAPISPGSSGGPVLNSKGEVVGVAVATFRGGQNLNFAIPSPYLISLLAKTNPLAALSTLKKAQSSLSAQLGKKTLKVLLVSSFCGNLKNPRPVPSPSRCAICYVNLSRMFFV